MDSDRLNRWITLGANIGVLIGIILILIELDQNADLMRAQIVQSRSESLEDRWRNLAYSDHLASIEAKRIESETPEKWVDSLTKEELVRVRAALYADMHNIRGQLYQYNQGYLDESFWNNTTRIQIRMVLRDFPLLVSPGTRMAPELRDALNEIADQEGLPRIPDSTSQQFDASQGPLLAAESGLLVRISQTVRYPPDSVEKLGFASGAKIHEEFDSVLRAIASDDQPL